MIKSVYLHCKLTVKVNNAAQTNQNDLNQIKTVWVVIFYILIYYLMIKINKLCCVFK